jgi:hypothetical protein
MSNPARVQKLVLDQLVTLPTPDVYRYNGDMAGVYTE